LDAAHDHVVLHVDRHLLVVLRLLHV
jgi:hypothetical protein